MRYCEADGCEATGTTDEMIQDGQLWYCPMHAGVDTDLAEDYATLARLAGQVVSTYHQSYRSYEHEGAIGELDHFLKLRP